MFQSYILQYFNHNKEAVERLLLERKDIFSTPSWSREFPLGPNDNPCYITYVYSNLKKKEMSNFIKQTNLTIYIYKEIKWYRSS